MSAAEVRPLPRGRFVDIGGRRLRIICDGPKGQGPAVILEAGAFGLAADWAAVQQLLAAGGVHSCAYDRAGMGFSDPGPDPRDGLAVAADLEALLAAADEPAPYILVGHSMAGLRLPLFVGRNPAKAIGLVLVDAATPEDAETSATRAMISQFTGVSRMAAWGASAGLMRPLGFMADTIGLPPRAAAEKRWAFANGRHNRTAAAEVETWMATARQALAAGPLDPLLPVAVITAGRNPQGQDSPQAAPARRSRHGYYANVARAHHASLLGAKFAAEIVKGIDFVRAAAASEGLLRAEARGG